MWGHLGSLVAPSACEGGQVLDGLVRGHAPAAVVEVDQHVAVVPDAQRLHVRDVAQAMAARHALGQVAALLWLRHTDHIDGGLIDGHNVRRGEYVHVGRHDGGCRDARGPVGRARGRAPLALVHGEVVDVWHWMLYNYVIEYYKSLELPL